MMVVDRQHCSSSLAGPVGKGILAIHRAVIIVSILHYVTSCISHEHYYHA